MIRLRRLFSRCYSGISERQGLYRFSVAPADDHIVKYIGAVIAQLVRQSGERSVDYFSDIWYNIQVRNNTLNAHVRRNRYGQYQFKITKDKNVIPYIKLIKEFDKTVSANGISIAEIKKRIEENQFVYSFDLDAGDWMYIENMP